MRAGFFNRVRFLRIVKWTSAVMVVVLLIAWGVSLRKRWMYTDSNAWRVVSAPHGVFVQVLRSDGRVRMGDQWNVWGHDLVGMANVYGDGVWFEGYRDPYSIELLTPYWSLLLAFMAMAASAWSRERVLAARSLTRCTRCTYPRAGLPIGTPCPECGTPQKSRE